jgi:hypothetical protein
MSKHIINAGATSQRFYIYLQDSTTGQGELSVTGATCYYVRDAVSGTMPAAVTLTFGASFASPGTYPAWSSGQVRELAYMPGLYLVDLPDAIFAAGARNAVVQIFPTSGTPWLPVNLEFTLSAVSLFDSVRMGMTALPNTAVTTNGSLITSGTGTAQLSVASGLVTLAGVTHTNAVIPTVTTVTNNVGVGSIAANAITATSINADAITSAKIADGTLTAAKFGDSALVIGSGAAGGVKAYLGAGSITAGVIATDAIDADAIANSAITIRMSGDGTPSEGRIIAGSIASDVWNASLASYNAGSSFGQRILRSSNAQSECDVSASRHIAADVHALQNAVITAASIATGAIDADALATDAVTEIAAGTWNYDISAISTPGTAGLFLTDTNVDTSNILSSVATIEASTTVIESIAYKQSMADYLLGRNIAGGSDGGRTVKDAFRALRNKSEIVGTTLTVYQENDTTSAWTATVSSSASADPVTGIDPA